MSWWHFPLQQLSIHWSRLQPNVIFEMILILSRIIIQDKFVISIFTFYILQLPTYPLKIMQHRTTSLNFFWYTQIIYTHKGACKYKGSFIYDVSHFKFSFCYCWVCVLTTKGTIVGHPVVFTIWHLLTGGGGVQNNQNNADIINERPLIGGVWDCISLF